MSYFLFFSHDPQIIWFGALARELTRRTGTPSVLWVTGEHDAEAGRKTEDFHQVTDVLAGFEADQAPAEFAANLEYLASLEQEQGAPFFHRYVAMDRHIERRRWPREVNAAFAAHLGRVMRRELAALGQQPVACFGETNVVQYRMALQLMNPEVPYWNHSVVRHWNERYFLDHGQTSIWPACQQLYREYRAEGVPEELRERARQKLDTLRQRDEQPLYTRQASRGGTGVASKITGGRMGVVVEDWLRELRAQRHRNNPSVQTPWQLSPVYKTAQNFLGSARRQYYDDHAASEIPAGIKLAAYFLHVQPEHTVEGMAFDFRNQAALVENIAAQLPADTLLVVKEHKGMIGLRQVGYYQQFLRLPNVLMLSDTINPYQLLRRCEVVFTLTGTVALEAMFEGVPAVVFGNIFFEDFEGAYKVRSMAELRHAMQRLARGELAGASEQAAVATLAAEWAASRPGKFGPPYSIEDTLDQQNISRLADDVERALEQWAARPERLASRRS